MRSFYSKISGILLVRKPLFHPKKNKSVQTSKTVWKPYFSSLDTLAYIKVAQLQELKHTVHTIGLLLLLYYCI